ncbi:hypothetical protein J7L48_01610 [bacterium]|nr:hypothetical protein [bacterium]
MNKNYKVKGSSMKSKFDFVKENFSTQKTELIMELFKDRDIFPILESQWYDYSIYIDILNTIAVSLFDGDLTKLQKLGAYSAKLALTGVYKSFMAKKDFLLFLKNVSYLHTRFYNMGKMNVDIISDNNVKIILADAPRYDEPDIYIALGFYIEAASLCGITNVKYSFEKIENGVKYILNW